MHLFCSQDLWLSYAFLIKRQSLINFNGKENIYGNREVLLAGCLLDFIFQFFQRTSINMGQEFPTENKLIVVFEMDYSNK